MAMDVRGSELINDWPEESREAAKLVIEAHGEPQEATESSLIWHDAGPWKRIVASKDFFAHEARRGNDGGREQAALHVIVIVVCE